MATSLCAIVIGLFVGSIFKPGVGLELAHIAGVAKEAKSPGLVEILLNIIPTNLFGSIANAEVLPTICFCLFFGIALAFCKDSESQAVRNAANNVYLFFEGVSSVMFKVVGWVMQYAPIGVFALILIVFSKSGAEEAFGPLANVTISVYIGLALQISLVYCVACLIVGLNPIVFIKKVRPPMITAFVTRSSGATLPISMETAEKDMGVHRSIYGFTLPVGSTINMDGATIYL